MKKHYHFVFLSNTPSFYKLNLCRELAKSHSLLLVLLGYGSEAVNQTPEHEPFDVVFLHAGDLHRRPKCRVFFRLLRLMHRISADRILFSGWFVPEFNLFSFLNPKQKNALICESSVLDSSLSGLKGWVKRRIIHRMSAALPSGKPHRELFERMGFNGSVHTTGSVGLIRYSPRVLRTETRRPLRYLFVGRLIPVKNVLMLAQEFKSNGKPLTIVGTGPLEQDIRKLHAPNITLTGFIPNEQLHAVYQEHDVFILPSLYEPWGLVVEEALYHGLPVIVSDKVGSAWDMVAETQTGIIFRSDSMQALQTAIFQMEQKPEFYRRNVLQLCWENRKKKQLDAYRNLQAHTGP